MVAFTAVAAGMESTAIKAAGVVSAAVEATEPAGVVSAEAAAETALVRTAIPAESTGVIPTGTALVKTAEVAAVKTPKPRAKASDGVATTTRITAMPS